MDIQTQLNASGSVPLVTLNSSRVTIGFKYEFYCKVTNFLGINKTAKIETRRENKDVPILKVVKQVKVSRDLPTRLEGNVIFFVSILKKSGGF